MVLSLKLAKHKKAAKKLGQVKGKLPPGSPCNLQPYERKPEHYCSCSGGLVMACCCGGCCCGGCCAGGCCGCCCQSTCQSCGACHCPGQCCIVSGSPACWPTPGAGQVTTAPCPNAPDICPAAQGQCPCGNPCACVCPACYVPSCNTKGAGSAPSKAPGQGGSGGGMPGSSGGQQSRNATSPVRTSRQHTTPLIVRAQPCNLTCPGLTATLVSDLGRVLNQRPTTQSLLTSGTSVIPSSQNMILIGGVALILVAFLVVGRGK